jgi:cytochrome b subunit of formate dehydrogenase
MGEEIDTMQERTESMAQPASVAPAQAATQPRYYRRFDRPERIGHVALMISFVGLAITGLPLLFSEQPWAGWLARSLGGFEAAGFLHRFFAVVMVTLFVWHLARVFRRVAFEGDWGMLWGPRSMVPQPRDVREFYQHILFFLGLRDRPRFERYAYWEKFDYWAVFWGMAIIGGSGLIMWFPGFFTQFLPGWTLNLALLIHGAEALLAVGFIFTIHLFNNHLRAEKFPMDLVMFTGHVSEEELRTERPDEYERLRRQGTLADYETEPAKPGFVIAARVYGTVIILLGLFTLGLILYSVLG